MSLAKRLPAGAEHFRRDSFSVPHGVGTTLIVPLRDPHLNEDVVCFAADLATRLKGRVRLLHVRHPALSVAADDMLLIDDGAQTVFRLRSTDYLEAVIRRCSEAMDVHLSAKTCIGSDLARIAKDELRTGSELVVFRRQARPEWQQIWLERELRQLLHLPVPVLILPPAAQSAVAWLGGGPGRVLVSIDDNLANSDAVRLAVELGGRDARYNLLRVLPMQLLNSVRRNRTDLSTGNSAAANSRNQAWYTLRRARERIEQYGVTADVNVIFDNLAAGRAILSQAVSCRADFVVLTRQHSGRFPWAHRAWKHVALNSHVPVLLCPDLRS